MSGNETKSPSFGVSLLAVAAIIAILMVGILLLHVDLHILLILGIISTTLIGMSQGISFTRFADGMARRSHQRTAGYVYLYSDRRADRRLDLRRYGAGFNVLWAEARLLGCVPADGVPALQPDFALHRHFVGYGWNDGNRDDGHGYGPWDAAHGSPERSSLERSSAIKCRLFPILRFLPPSLPEPTFTIISKPCFIPRCRPSSLL